ncbi:MAG: 50S ribosomal protein L23 [Candidatus Marinimicrobia bacterium]|nr:50S ribosomal protein L23 [Candidatus Neomarinimicrobiota bacterium]
MRAAEDIIRTVQLTEKGTLLTEQANQYLFEVDRTATKPEIARAVTQLFKVHVTQVRTLNQRGKLKRERTAHFGRTARRKRAIVTLRAGDKIDLT